MRRRLRVVQTHRAEKIALDRARSGAPISPQCNRAPKPPNRAHRRRGTLAKSQCKPNFRRLVPTMMAFIAGGTRVGRVCSVAFGLIARRVGRVTRIAMVGCASGRTRTIERDTKGAKTRFIALAYGKFESSSLQRRVGASRFRHQCMPTASMNRRLRTGVAAATRSLLSAGMRCEHDLRKPRTRLVVLMATLDQDRRTGCLAGQLPTARAADRSGTVSHNTGRVSRPARPC